MPPLHSSFATRHRRTRVWPAFAAVLLALSAQTAGAATAYYVNRVDVYARAKPQSYAMGRLYTDDRMDVQYVDSNGWAYGYAYGYVNRCVWAQYSNHSEVNFRTNGTAVANRCRTSNMYLSDSEFSNGEIWTNSAGTDGVTHTLSQASHMWDNWVWGGAWGNHVYRGVAAAGSVWKIRYTTNDGVGVMARPCVTNSAGTLECLSDWYFIQRSSL
ncbi:MAG: hypothetical protein ACREP7_15320 [Lysobacter sp.]